MRILVLDDDCAFANGLALLLGQMGHEATVAHDCNMAHRAATDRQFDVILADVELPDGDGRQLCDILRMRSASDDAYMIAVTGRTDLGDADFPAFDGYVRKPVTYELLEGILEEWRTAAGLDTGVTTRTGGLNSEARQRNSNGPTSESSKIPHQGENPFSMITPQRIDGSSAPGDQ